MNSKAVLDRQFLEIRAKLLDIAASLDRIERSDGDVDEDDRMKLIAKSIEILAGSSCRAERIQLLFSRDYQQNWKSTFGIATAE